jgi:hypothetical protein
MREAGNYFLEPWALVLLAGLIPLIIVYLVKPKPKEMVLPSLRFFMDKKKDSKIRSALRRIRRNIFLLLHIILISGLAFAGAQPYMEGEVQPKSSVLVLDRSASMNDDFERAKDYLRDRAGETNTLIVVDEEVRVLETDASASQVNSRLNGIEPTQTSSDIASMIRELSSFDGKVFIASDMDHTTGRQNVNSMISDLQARREVEIMQTDQENNWGIVDATPGRNTEIEVENFEDEAREIDVSYGDRRTSIQIEPGEVRTLNLDLDPGRTTVKLEEDGYSPDNSYHVYIPEQESYRTVLVGENRHMETAFRIINFTSPETVEAGTSEIPDADIYVLTESAEILPAVREKALARAPQSKVIVQQSEGNLNALGLEGEPQETRLSIRKPVNTVIGETEVHNVSSEGYESLSSPGNALMLEGNRSVLVYNIEDSDFRERFLYPVFLKRAVSQMTDTRTVENSHLEAGEGAKGERLAETGFHEVNGKTYAVNHVNRDESVSEKTFIRGEESGSATGEKNMSHLLIAVLLLLVLAEYAFLDRQGDLI